MSDITRSPRRPAPSEAHPVDRYAYSYLSLDFIVFLASIVITINCLGALLYGVVNEYATAGGSAAEAVRGTDDVGNTTRQLMLSPLYIYGIYFFAVNWKKAYPMVIKSLPLLILTGLTLVSTLWSLSPEGTARRASNLIAGTAFALYLASRYPIPQFIKLLSVALIVVCVISFVGVFLTPEIGIHHDKHFPAWRGYFAHKNQLGNSMVCAFSIGLMALTSKSNRTIGIILMLLSTVLMMFSLSRSAWVLALVILLIYGFLLLARKNKTLGLVLIGFLSISFIIFLLFGDPVTTYDDYLGYMGKDVTLSGRTVIWTQLIKTVADGHLWFGFGYDSFWTSPKGALIVNWGMHDFIPPHAHNGWLQVFSHLGLVGLGLIIFVFLQGLFFSFQLAMKAPNMQYSFGFIYILLYAFINMSESTIMARDHFQWILFVYLFCNSTQYKTIVANGGQALASKMTVRTKRRPVVQSVTPSVGRVLE